MKKTTGRSFFSLSYIFASFFGAFMIAAVFAYNNYRFSEYKFINFEDLKFYEKTREFIPKNDRYIMLVFSSNMSDLSELSSKIDSNTTILAVDLFQKRFENTQNIISISAGINTLLRLIKNIGISEVPSVFYIKKNQKLIYKQDGPIQII